MRVRTTLFVFLLFAAASVFAQTVTIGNVFTSGGYGPATGVTAIDLAHPATANGTIDKVGFALGTFDDVCPDYAMVKFFRRQGETLTMIAQRGPISWTSDTEPTPLDSPVYVLEGDLIAITPLTSCGHLIAMTAQDWGDVYLGYSTDVTGTVSISTPYRIGRLALWGTGTGEPAATEHTARILPVVGSLRGAYGSEWRTSVQLLNPYDTPANGHFVLHRAGNVGDDVTLPYSLAAGATQTYEDIVVAMGATGLGSLDVVTDHESEDAGRPPVVIAEIFNFSVYGGRLGFATDAFDAQDHTYDCATSNETMIGTRVLKNGVTGFLVAPQNALQTRFNIGVRSLGSGATLTATLLTASGQTAATVTKDYPSNHFDQQSAAAFLGVPLTGGESIRITVTSGSAIIYGTSTDNVTSDSAIQYVYSRFFGETQ